MTIPYGIHLNFYIELINNLYTFYIWGIPKIDACFLGGINILRVSTVANMTAVEARRMAAEAVRATMTVARMVAATRRMVATAAKATTTVARMAAR